MGKRKVIKKDSDEPVEKDRNQEEFEKLIKGKDIQKTMHAQFDKDGNYHGDRYDENGRFIKGDSK